MELTCETCGMRIVDIAEARRQGEQHEPDTEPYLHYNPTYRFYTQRDHPAQPAIEGGLERVYFVPTLPTPTLADEIAEGRRIAAWVAAQPHAE
jgi:hypothetical protein